MVFRFAGCQSPIPNLQSAMFVPHEVVPGEWKCPYIPKHRPRCRETYLPDDRQRTPRLF